MLATPDTSHVPVDRVYEPAEDSFLLCDAINTDAIFLSQRFPPAETPSPILVEVCVGSGIVLAFSTAHAEQLFGRADLVTMGIDVNHFACRAATDTVLKSCPGNQKHGKQLSGTLLDVFNGDLLQSLRKHSVDILICNPPYVPSEELPVLPSANDSNQLALLGMLALATDGGADGMEVTNRLLDALSYHLTLRGVAYVVLCARNKPELIKSRIRNMESGRVWAAETILQRQAGFEKLQIIRIWRR